MDSVAKQYNLVYATPLGCVQREIADKIDREARRAAFREERIEPFRKVSIYAMNMRIIPDKYLPRPNTQMSLYMEYIIAYMGMNRLTFAMFSKDKRDGSSPSLATSMYENGRMAPEDLRIDFDRHTDVHLYTDLG